MESPLLRGLVIVRVLMHFLRAAATANTNRAMLSSPLALTPSLSRREREKKRGRRLAAQAFAQIAHDIRERQVARLFLATTFVFDGAFVEALVTDD